MKTHILSGMLLLSLGLGCTFTACDDEEDYTVQTAPIISSVQTGDAEVTAVSATAKALVQGLAGQSASAYSTGVYYGTDPDPKANGSRAVGSVDADGNVVVNLADLETNKTYYYCAYVTLQNRVSYFADEVKSFTTTSAILKTADASDITAVEAKIGAQVSGLDGVAIDVISGCKLGLMSDADALKAGYDIPGAKLDGGTSFAIDQKSLVPSTTYYYLPYINLGSGYVYGEVKSFTTAAYEPEYVDLGLSVMWATTNVGAINPEDAGAQFGWGDLSGLQTSTDISDYAEGKNIFASAADVCAAKQLGRMPSAEDVRELVNNTTSEWTTVNGVGGFRFTAANGNSIFLPAAGKRSGSTVSGANVVGAYWSGSVNEGNTNYGQTLAFNGQSANISTAMRTEGLSIRPVKKGSVALNTSLISTTWLLDIDASEASYAFDGPVYFYGTDDNWQTVTDQDISAGNSWSWCPVWKDNTWICEAKDYGQMELTTDGKVIVTVGEEKSEGTYTIDEVNHTISLDGVKLLHPANFDESVSNWSTDLKILALAEGKMQIGVFRDADPATLSFNFISASAKENAQAPVYEGCPAYISFSTPNWWPSVWGAATNHGNADVTGDGTYTVRVNDIGGDCDGTNVFVVDIFEYAKKHADVMDATKVTVDKILLDGQELAVDNSKIKYGDLENNGNLRIEIYNDYGSTKDDAPINVSDVKFSKSIEVTFTIKTQAYTAAISYATPIWWPSYWGGGAGDVKVKGDGTYTVSMSDLGGDCESAIVFCVDIAGLAAAVTDANAVVAKIDKIVMDGTTELAVDNSKIKYGDLEEKGNYRIEIYNEYGSTKADAPINIGDIKFSNKMEITFTLSGVNMK